MAGGLEVADIFAVTAPRSAPNGTSTSTVIKGG